jgi:hypothetical protein
MKKYIIPRNKRQHLVVEEGVHNAIRLYASQRQLSIVEATYRLLKLGFCHEYGLHVADDDFDEYQIKKPLAFDFKNWFRRI